MKWLWLTLFISQVALGTPDCDYNFSLPNATIQIEETARVVQQNFTVYRGQNSPNGRCEKYRLFFSKGVANSYQRKAFTLFLQSLNYNLHQNINQSGILKDFSDATNANEYVEGNAPSKFTTYTDKFFVAVPGQDNNVLAAGTYVDIIQASIYGYNPNSGNYNFEETSNFTVLLVVQKKVQISLLNEGDPFDASSTSKTLDFGVLAQNQERAADLRILSNGSYKINVSSINNGKLKLTSANETINYVLKVNNSSVSLSSSSSSPVEIGSGTMTSQAGDLYKLKVQITESTNNKSAGLYQDVITITAIAN